MTKQLKLAAAIIIFSASFVACSHNEATSKTILARVCSIDNELLTVAYPNRDTLLLYMPDYVRRQVGNIFVDDAAAVTLSGDTIVELVVIYHGKPQINNVNAMLIGTWHSQNNIPELAGNITFNTSGTLSYFASAENLQNRKWEICGKELYIASDIDTSARKYNIVRLDDSTLTISNAAGEIFRFAKDF